jgi:hypothetical protein
MKNQYFGDVNDYRKYGLLRALQSTWNGSLLVAWMLTPDDGGRDGRFRSQSIPDLNLLRGEVTPRLAQDPIGRPY